MRLSILISTAALTALAGCVSTAEVKPEHFPTAAVTRTAIVQYVRENFKDPYSLRDAEISNSWRVQGTEQRFGSGALVVCARMNGKNSYGAYTGKKSTIFTVRDGKVIDSIEDSYLCDDAQRAKTWSPFSEVMAIR